MQISWDSDLEIHIQLHHNVHNVYASREKLSQVANELNVVFSMLNIKVAKNSHMNLL